MSPAVAQRCAGRMAGTAEDCAQCNTALYAPGSKQVSSLCALSAARQDVILGMQHMVNASACCARTPKHRIDLIVMCQCK